MIDRVILSLIFHTIITIFNQLAKETPYSRDNCLRMLHSNLWNYDKTKKDLGY